MYRISKIEANEMIDKICKNNPNMNNLSESAKITINSYDGDIYINNKGESSQTFILSKSAHVRLATMSITVSQNSLKFVKIGAQDSYGNAIRYETFTEINETKDGHLLKSNKFEMNSVRFRDISDRFEPSQLKDTKLDKTKNTVPENERVCLTQTSTTEHDKDNNLVMSTFARNLSTRKKYVFGNNVQPQSYVNEEFSTMKDNNGQYFTVYKDAVSGKEKVFTGEQSFDPVNLNKFIDPNKKERVSLSVKPDKELEEKAILSYFSQINEGKLAENQNKKGELSEMMSNHIADTQSKIKTTTSEPQFGE